MFELINRALTTFRFDTEYNKLNNRNATAREGPDIRSQKFLTNSIPSCMTQQHVEAMKTGGAKP